jgi:hypothetical protein
MVESMAAVREAAGMNKDIDLVSLLQYVRRPECDDDWRWAHQLTLVTFKPFRLGKAVAGYGIAPGHPIGSWVAQRVATTPMSRELVDLVLGGMRTSPVVGLAWHPEASDDLLRSLLLSKGGCTAAIAGRQDICARPELLPVVMTCDAPERPLFNIGRVAARSGNDVPPGFPVLERLMPWAPAAAKSAFLNGLSYEGRTNVHTERLQALVR